MNSSCNVLQVATHATRRPLHGGQLRSHHIGRVLEEAGYTVRTIAVCFRQAHDIDNEREAILDLYTSRSWRGSIAGGVFVDYFHCAAVADDPALRSEFFRLADLAIPHVVLLEHPWMWPLVRLIPSVAAGSVPVIYNSQNVEAHLKANVVRELKLAAAELSEAQALLPVIDRFEREVVSNVAAVTACTPEDQQVFSTWGAKRTLLIRNGSSRRPRTGLQRPLPDLIPADHQFALMIGSGHPPNVTGFENLVLPWISRLRPGQRVVVAGLAGEWLKRRLTESSALWALDGRLVLLGRVNDLTLSALVENAGCIILPIEYGGGSNIKTAESLLSDCPIIATPASMRGFEQFVASAGVTIAEGPEAFAKAVLTALANYAPAQRDPASVTALTWDVTLAPLIHLVGALAGETNTGQSPVSSTNQRNPERATG